MKKFVIFTDSTADLPMDFIKKHRIEIIPLYYNMEDKIYGGDEDLEASVFYEKMRTGIMPTTMASNPEFIAEKYAEYIAQGTDILHIAFSSALSGSCNNAFITARELSEENPEIRIVTIDSLAASMGQGLLVYKAVTMMEAGKTIEETTEYIEEIKFNLCHQFTVEDLNHLHRGGRVSKTAAVIGTMINLKPILHVDDEGRLTPLQNVRGRKKSLNTLVDNMEILMGRFRDQNDMVMISHGDSLEDANYVAELIRQRFNIQDIMINYVCPTIGAHSGPGTIALFFMGEKR